MIRLIWDLIKSNLISNNEEISKFVCNQYHNLYLITKLKGIRLYPSFQWKCQFHGKAPFDSIATQQKRNIHVKWLVVKWIAKKIRWKIVVLCNNSIWNYKFIQLWELFIVYCTSKHSIQFIIQCSFMNN